MYLSIFDIFKIGVGPSSSHTGGPMVAAARFLALLADPQARVPGAGALARVECRLHGSLAYTGKGHATDRAVMLGLAGFTPELFDAARVAEAEKAILETKTISPPGFDTLSFDPESDIIFDFGPPLEGHANGMVLSGYDAAGDLFARETYYSVGGGFVLSEAELSQKSVPGDTGNTPYPFRNADEMLKMAAKSSLTIAQMKQQNEAANGNTSRLKPGILALWDVMNRSIDEGLSTSGELPGGLKTRRRANGIHQALLAERGQNLSAPHTINDWISVYAMAVNEVNAAGGRVVTAPTNGASGVLPATLRYYLDHFPGASRDRIEEFMLTAAAIGGLLKTNASISGAEVGCQGEVGSAAAMAAAGLCAVLGGSPEQIENAAEIALEHHLGMTCDPVAGLVQVPCIERNGLGAIKAVSAASIALRGDGKHLISLDACIETMRQTGRDMDVRYKETSLGGLAVSLPEC